MMQDAFGTIRIAYVVHGFQAGGLARCVARLVDALDRSRFQPCIICLDRSGAAASWVKATDVPIIELRKSVRGGLGLIRRLAAAFREHHIDVAHSHNWGTLGETAAACRLVRPRVLHVHAERGTVLGPATASVVRRRLRGAVMRQTLTRADAVLSNSHETARRVAAVTGIPASHIRIIPNGLDTPLADRIHRDIERQRVRRLLDLTDDSVLVGSVGRLVSVKDFPTAIQAMAAANNAGVPVHLLLVGDGPERDRLREAANQAAVSDRVHFVGEQADVGPWYAAMDLYLNTSISEGMSQSVVEAMAMGLPLIVTDVGDHRRLVEEGGCGRVAEPGDAAAIGAAFAELSLDQCQREELGTRAAALHATNHSLSAMITKYERFYESVAAQRITQRPLMNIDATFQTAACADASGNNP